MKKLNRIVTFFSSYEVKKERIENNKLFKSVDKIIFLGCVDKEADEEKFFHKQDE